MLAYTQQFLEVKSQHV